MFISRYAYGTITVDNKTYDRDLILFPDRVRQNWWRKEGHSLCPEDLKEIFDYRPDTLIVGTGESGVMDIPALTKEAVKKQGIVLIATDTALAVKTFNDHMRSGKKSVGAFHLTC